MVETDTQDPPEERAVLGATCHQDFRGIRGAGSKGLRTWFPGGLVSARGDGLPKKDFKARPIPAPSASQHRRALCLQTSCECG